MSNAKGNRQKKRIVIHWNTSRKPIISAWLNYAPFLVAKIERARARAWKHIDAIIAAADGIMVARGDLGVEVPIGQIALIQKRLIRKARAAGKPVITATQMLESMVHNRRPTRAEVTDVANAILDGTDCVMLSEESAMGDYPVDAVKMLAGIARITEKSRSELSPLNAETLHDAPVWNPSSPGMCTPPPSV